MQLRRLPAESCDADRVLEQPARVRVVALGRGQPTERSPNPLVLDESADDATKPWMRNLACEKLEESVQLGCVAPQRRRELGRIRLSCFHRTDVQLEPVAESLDSPKDAHGIPLAEPAVEQLDVGPDARLDP